MLLRKMEYLPVEFQSSEILPYYRSLSQKQGRLFCKRIFDCITALFLLILLSPLLLGIGIWVKCDSKGPVLFRQIRITQFGKSFFICKFRTMVPNDSKTNPQVTAREDSRITKAGKILRRLRLDELPQLWNVLKGEMSFVGIRPEVPRYVKEYTPQMWATLLLPAGITSPASISFSKEEEYLAGAEDPEKMYLEQILPQKMVQNLRYIENFSLMGDLKIMWETIRTVFFPKKENPS